MTHRDSRGRFTKTTPANTSKQTHEPIFNALVEKWRAERPKDLAHVAVHVRIPDVDIGTTQKAANQ